MDKKEWIKREDGDYELELETGQKACLEKVYEHQNLYILRWFIGCHSYAKYIVAESDEDAVLRATIEIYNKCYEIATACCDIQNGLPDINKLYCEAHEDGWEESDEGIHN